MKDLYNSTSIQNTSMQYAVSSERTQTKQHIHLFMQEKLSDISVNPYNSKAKITNFTQQTYIQRMIIQKLYPNSAFGLCRKMSVYKIENEKIYYGNQDPVEACSQGLQQRLFDCSTQQCIPTETQHYQLQLHPSYRMYATTDCGATLHMPFCTVGVVTGYSDTFSYDRPITYHRKLYRAHNKSQNNFVQLNS